VIVEYIDAHREEFGVDPICRVFTEQAGVQIAPSTYYAAKQQGPVSAADLDDAYDANTVVDLWVADRRVYGVRKLWHAAQRAGHDWGRDRVARLMRIAGIDGVVRGKHTTKTTERDKDAPPRHPDLIGRAWSTPTRPDQWWVADFTYSAQFTVMCSSAGGACWAR
jgi:putative transposase